MIFNSLPFAIFLPCVFIIYWLIGGRRIYAQNVFLLIASYFFYCWWDWRFSVLLFSSTAFSFLVTQRIHLSIKESSKKIWLFLGILQSLGLLIFFKYFDFFITSFSQLLGLMGFQPTFGLLNLILPLGISFYTFKILSYILDSYWGKITPTKNFINYSLYISFFPQIVSGPIEKASSLLPQLESSRKFSYPQASEGMKLILWGLFKKVVIADTTAGYVQDIFSNYSLYPASMLWLGILYFAFQIYADFSGYTDIVIGIGKLLGLELMQNFNRPFISKNITEFWRRWHISLSSWFNDYVFTPFYTRFRNGGNVAMYLGIMLTFFLSGLWHGENWNYIFFGVMHGGAIVLETATKKKRKKLSAKISPFIYSNGSMLLTFLFVILTWVFFRSKDMTTGFEYFKGMFNSSILEIPGKLKYIPFIVIMMTWEWLQRKRKHAMDFSFPLPVRWGVYLVMSLFILYYFGNGQQFFYFQF